jgi:hypothetical protein
MILRLIANEYVVQLLDYQPLYHRQNQSKQRISLGDIFALELFMLQQRRQLFWESLFFTGILRGR